MHVDSVSFPWTSFGGRSPIPCQGRRSISGPSISWRAKDSGARLDAWISNMPASMLPLPFWPGESCWNINPYHFAPTVARRQDGFRYIDLLAITCWLERNNEVCRLAPAVLTAIRFFNSCEAIAGIFVPRGLGKLQRCGSADIVVMRTAGNKCFRQNHIKKNNLFM